MTVRALIVDDSRSIQLLLTAVLESDPEIEVVGTAASPNEARALIKSLNPDVLTLDIEMPGMNGLEFLRKIMKLRPMPVIMISTLTEKGASASIAALSIGAFECLPKPKFGDEQALQEMCDAVKLAAKSSIVIKRNAIRATKTGNITPKVKTHPDGPKLVLIGSSTGGVEALSVILSEFPGDCPPTVVTQHIPARFAESLTKRLDHECAPKISLAKDGTILKPGHVYIAPGSIGHTTIICSTDIRCKVKNGTPCNGHMPSVDELFGSAAKYPTGKVAAALLTGMGRDGAEGLRELRKTGAYTIAQDKETSVIYGMPAAAVKIGAVCEILPLHKIAKALLECRK